MIINCHFAVSVAIGGHKMYRNFMGPITMGTQTVLNALVMFDDDIINSTKSPYGLLGVPCQLSDYCNVLVMVFNYITDYSYCNVY